MPILVRSMLVCQSVVDLRFFVLVSWSGEGPPLTLWFSPPRWGPQAPPGFPSPLTPSGVLCVLGSGSLSAGCIIAGDRLVLCWCIRGRIAQDAIEHADDFVTDGHQGALSCAFAGGLVLATCIIALQMGLMRDEPQGVVREPVPQVGTADGRHFGAFSDPRAAFGSTAIEASQCDQLFAMRVRVHSANGGQEGRGGRLADPG